MYSLKSNVSLRIVSDLSRKEEPSREAWRGARKRRPVDDHRARSPSMLNLNERTVLKLVTDGALPGASRSETSRHLSKAMIDTWLATRCWA